MIHRDFLPRTHFLAEVHRAAHGASDTLHGVAAEAEDCRLSVLPPELILQPTGTRDPVLLLIGSPPLVTVKGQGLPGITEAIRESLPQVLANTGADERFAIS